MSVGWDGGEAVRIVPYLALADALCEVQVWAEGGLAGPTLYVNGTLPLARVRVPALARGGRRLARRRRRRTRRRHRRTT